MTQLRPFQSELSDGIAAQWAGGARNVLAVAPTGAGKTVLFAHKLRQHVGASVAIAHRQELVSQISIALARNGVRHRIIGPAELVKRVIVPLHVSEVGASLYDPNAPCAVAGVDTLIRMDGANPWLRQVTLWVTDEAHHVLRGNKWGKACEMFPNARGLGVTATPCRADRKGLGRHADGLFDALVVGPSMRELIADGYLTDYRVWIAPELVDVSDVPIGASGDYVEAKLRAKVHAEKRFVGDVVRHYVKHAAGRLGVTFAVDIESATELAAAYRAAGVPAEVVSSKTPDRQRIEILRRFRRREVLQLVNVDLFGEGFDLPAIEVVSMARHTASYGLYCQQFGRALRLMLPGDVLEAWGGHTHEQRLAAIAASGKPRAMIIDHVGNVARHGLPDIPRDWTLDGGEKRGKVKRDDEVPVRACPACTAAYLRVLPACPECGHRPQPTARSAPEFVDGDLLELDPDTLARMRGEVARVDAGPVYPAGLPAAAYGAIKRNHWERQQAQGRLRECIAWWAGYQRSRGRSDSESYKRFFFAFGVDVATAQTLNKADAEALATRVAARLAADGVSMT